MRYVDTSILIAFLIPEPGSNADEAFMTSAGDPLAMSSWSEVELVSALGVKLRTRQITMPEANTALDVYARIVLPRMRRIQVNDADQRRAMILLKGWRTALRAGDSLHLAIAGAHSATLYTFDKGMAKAAATLGVAVHLVNVP